MKSSYITTFDKIRVCPCSFILEGYLDTKVPVAMQCKGLTKRHKAYLVKLTETYQLTKDYS